MPISDSSEKIKKYWGLFIILKASSRRKTSDGTNSEYYLLQSALSLNFLRYSKSFIAWVKIFSTLCS